MEKEVLYSIISTLVYLIGNIPYLIGMFRGRTIPHPFSVGVWIVLVGFNCYVLGIHGEWWAFLPSFTICTTLVLCFIFGVKMFQKVKINWFDYFCLILAILLLVYYFLSKDITNTVFLTILIDILAYLPTFKKGWLQPWTETIFAYFMASVNQIFTLLSLSLITFDISAFWIYCLIANLIFSFMVFFRRWNLKGWKSIFQ